VVPSPSAETCLAVTDAVYGRLNVNVALNRPTFASSVWPFSNGPFLSSYAVDGNKDVVAEQVDTSCFATEGEANPWWAVDLGAALAVVGVLFTNRGENYGNVHLHYQVKPEMSWQTLACSSPGIAGNSNMFEAAETTGLI